MKSHTFIYKNSTISYSDQGKGSAIIFLHGFLESKKLWKNFEKKLKNKFRVICLDLLGHGKSDCIGYIHTMEDQCDMLFALISHLRLRKVTLVGHSMGGYVALAFAEFYPDFMKRLILINSSSRADSEERISNRKRAKEIVQKNPTAFISMATKNLFDAHFYSENKQKVEKFTKKALKTPIQGVIASIEGMIERMDREMILHLGPYPKMMIAGNHDYIIPIHNAKDEATSSDVNLHILDCGHVAPLEKEDEVILLIKDFMKT